eukprot:5152571-Pyramimonas_sp.AAC.1
MKRTAVSRPERGASTTRPLRGGAERKFEKRGGGRKRGRALAHLITKPQRVVPPIIVQGLAEALQNFTVEVAELRGPR